LRFASVFMVVIGQSFPSLVVSGEWWLYAPNHPAGINWPTFVPLWLWHTVRWPHRDWKPQSDRFVGQRFRPRRESAVDRPS
jgi:hypothetical protein